MKEYSEVPCIIGTKDLDYLKDMFNWQYLAYKDTIDIINNIEDEDLSMAVKKVNDEVFSFLEEILQIMEDHRDENC